MKSLLLFFPIFFLSLSLFSQNLEIKKSEYFATDFTRKSDIIGKQDGLIYTCQYVNVKRSKRKPNALINILDEKLNFVSTIEVYPLDRNDIILKTYFSKGEYHIFFERYNSANYTSTLYVSKLNEDDEISSDIKEVGVVNVNASYKREDKRFSVRQSKDSENYIIECFTSFRKASSSLFKNIVHHVSFVKIDKELNITTTINTEKYRLIDFKRGTYFLSDTEVLFYKEFDSLFIYEPDKKEPFALKLPKYTPLIMLDEKITYDKKNNFLYIAGLLTERRSKKIQPSSSYNLNVYSTSYYWVKIDCESKDILSTKKESFSEEILNSFTDKYEISRVDNKFWISQISKMYLDNYGNITLNLRHSESQNTSSSQVIMSSKGVLILSLNESGDVTWHKSINLLQRSFAIDDFREFSTLLPDRLLYTYTTYLNNEHKVVAITIDNEGKTISRVEEGKVNVQNVFLNQQNYHNEDKLIISAFDKTGLFKADTYFLEVKY
jgi:hypothetical protein